MVMGMTNPDGPFILEGKMERFAGQKGEGRWLCPGGALSFKMRPSSWRTDPEEKRRES